MGPGRPKGSVTYKDENGNPIGVYEWRKLQQKLGKRIKRRIPFKKILISGNVYQYLLKNAEKTGKSINEIIIDLIKFKIAKSKEEKQNVYA